MMIATNEPMTFLGLPIGMVMATLRFLSYANAKPETRDLASASRLWLADVFIRPKHALFIRRRLGLFDNTRAGRKV